jgi:hypothetical protein
MSSDAEGGETHCKGQRCMTTKRMMLANQSFVFPFVGNFMVVDGYVPDNDSYTPFVNADSRLSCTIHKHTDREQLRGNLLQLTDTLGDGVRCINAIIESVVDIPAEKAALRRKPGWDIIVPLWGSFC